MSFTIPIFGMSIWRNWTALLEIANRLSLKVQSRLNLSVSQTFPTPYLHKRNTVPKFLYRHYTKTFLTPGSGLRISIVIVALVSASSPFENDWNINERTAGCKLPIHFSRWRRLMKNSRRSLIVCFVLWILKKISGWRPNKACLYNTRLALCRLEI